MSWKQNEKSSEIRLWSLDILIPASFGLVCCLYNAVPPFRDWVLDKKGKVISKVRR